ncbi:hypothetical protein BH09BAC1_BH09BAC1_28090 [soil metagenome]
MATILVSSLYLACSSSINVPVNETSNSGTSSNTNPNAIPISAGFSSWDADRNSSISITELGTGLDNDGLFNQWDVDGNGFISPNEYHAGVYARWDANGNGIISNDEWGNRNSVWDTQSDRNMSMNGWTNNSNTDMTPDQFNANFGTNSNFRIWDANLDNQLDRNEFNTGVYRTLDRDRDGTVDDIEFGGYYMTPSGGLGNAPNKININTGSTPANPPGSSPSGATPNSVPSGSGTGGNSAPLGHPATNP